MRILTLVAALCLSTVAAAQPDHSELALSLVNDDRAGSGLDPLVATETLSRAAQAHADDMLARGFYSHTAPDGDTVQDRVIAAGGDRWRLVAENIARCQGCRQADADRVRAFHSGWMQCPGHRKNILGTGLDSFGFGIAARDGVVYAVQVFGGPGRARGAPDGSIPHPVSPQEARAAALEALIAGSPSPL